MSSGDVIMVVIDEDPTASDDKDMYVGTLMQFHQRRAHLSYNTIERMPKDPMSGIQLSGKKRAKLFNMQFTHAFV